MARKKVQLAWIANASTRRATLKKRTKGLMKKVSELSTLCGVEACAIVYGPQEQQPEAVWPSAGEAARMVAHLKTLPEMEQCKKMVDQTGFLRQQATKLEEQLARQERDIRELETTLLMHQCLAGKSLDTVGPEEATRLAWMVEAKMKQVRDQIERTKARNGDQLEPASGLQPLAIADPPPFFSSPYSFDVGSSNSQMMMMAINNTAMKNYDHHQMPPAFMDGAQLESVHHQMNGSWFDVNQYGWLNPYFL